MHARVSRVAPDDPATHAAALQTEGAQNRDSSPVPVHSAAVTHGPHGVHIGPPHDIPSVVRVHDCDSTVIIGSQTPPTQVGV